MSSFAACVGDLHICPVCDPKPHLGGPIQGPGVSTVKLGGRCAAVEGTSCACAGPPDRIRPTGSKVRIGGKAAARMGDSTVHGGIILTGCPTVILG